MCIVGGRSERVRRVEMRKKGSKRLRQCDKEGKYRKGLAERVTKRER